MWPFTPLLFTANGARQRSRRANSSARRPDRANTARWDLLLLLCGALVAASCGERDRAVAPAQDSAAANPPSRGGATGASPEDPGGGRTGADASPIADAPNAEPSDEGQGEVVDDAPRWQETCSIEDLSGLFQRRIAPLARKNRGSSCNRCHLAGTDLAAFSRGDPCASMGCLLQLGLVDLESPADSRILAQIARGAPESDLYGDDVVREELEGFTAWIEFSARCHDTVCADVADSCPAPSAAAEPAADDPGGPDPLGPCDEDALVSSFAQRVYPWVDRCAQCHALGIDDAPRETCRGPCPEHFVCKTNGGCLQPTPYWVDFSAVNYRDPAAVSPADRHLASMRTMYNLIGLQAVDVERPHLSRMLTKPLAESDPSGDGIPHGGGDKMQDKVDDTYQDFLVWLEEYAACHRGLTPTDPVVVIDAPSGDARHVNAGQRITFRGRADDPQQGPLTGNSLIWFTGDAGTILGRGATISAVLPVGPQIVTLTATDGDGNQGHRRIRVTVR